MSNNVLPNYAPLAEFLFDSGAYTEACELHGLLCGFICNGLIAPNAVWMNLLLASADQTRQSELEACVKKLFQISLDQLSSFSFEFQILLPDAEPEQYLLPISKLSQWCESFLLGLGMTGPATKKPLEKDVQEAKEDIQKVSRIYHQVLQCDEPFDEEAFSDLLEHVRISVMLIFTELSGQTRPTHH